MGCRVKRQQTLRGRTSGSSMVFQTILMQTGHQNGQSEMQRNSRNISNELSICLRRNSNRVPGQDCILSPQLYLQAQTMIMKWIGILLPRDQTSALLHTDHSHNVTQTKRRQWKAAQHRTWGEKHGLGKTQGYFTISLMAAITQCCGE